MPSRAATASPVVFFGGTDDFTVQRRAREQFEAWSRELGGMDHEIIEATANTADQAIKAIGRLREALLTLPFFGGAKAVWFKDCNFLGEEGAGERKVGGAAEVQEALQGLAELLSRFDWSGVRLVISAGKVDRRKSFYKALEKLARVELIEALSADDRDWEDTAVALVQREAEGRGKSLSDAVAAALVEAVGPNTAQLVAEVEKLSLYVGERGRIERADVEAVVSRQKVARAFALGDALGERNLPLLMRRLDEELWAMQTDRKRSEIGLIYGLIAKWRAMLMAKMLVEEGWLRPRMNFAEVKAQMAKWPEERLARDKKYSPLGLNAYVLFRALEHSSRYTMAELVRGMEILLEANVKMVSSGQEEALILQQALTRMVGTASSRAGSAAGA
ncbi:MAG: DNA polymerase III subunit delta [Verrucomicrobiae bacterium]|nr:DNA polymerase III subunit delta [Verrucomicrobiae bacterium]